MNEETKEIYSEVYSVLNMLGEKYISKIPKSLFNFIKQEKNNDYNPVYSKNVLLSKQKIKRKSLSLIAIMHLNYWCDTEEEKKELKEIFKKNQEKHDAYIKEKYSVDKLFEKPKTETKKEIPSTNEVAMVEYKENVFKKILNKIKNIFIKK